MRPGPRAFLLTTLPLLLVLSAALAGADEITTNLQSKVIFSFDEPAGEIQWIVQGSKFTTKDYPQSTIVRTWPDSLYGRNPEEKNLFALGIHGRFDRKGYNYIEVIPARKGSDGKLLPAAFPLPGRVKYVDMWVWGSNYNYLLDVHLRDPQGVDRVLHLGSLAFAGWRNLSVAVQGNIPQARRHIPRFQGLDITKFVIWTTPTEKVDDFYVFFDEVKILTDLYETRFDGDELADPKTLDKLWTQGTR